MLVAAASVRAQVRPHPGAGDPRLQTVVYDPGQIVQLHGVPGYQLTVELSTDEQIQNVALGDSNAWQVSVNKAGDHLFLKPTQGGVATNMTVITNVRVYNFDLVPVAEAGPDVAYTVQFKYPAAPSVSLSGNIGASAETHPVSRYKLAGDRTLRPSEISDDGTRTYVRWPADRAIPATFQIDDDGTEKLVNGTMRGDRFVTDGIAKKLIFRIDQRVASASRLRPRKSR
ncbi:TrbG/VirB9 family P-type conjugative transfer protein [Sphingomonas sp.]|uniref:TrbG/VirB9 family P-type conjugative transfer protein n=1 Tax=Sphingomonas sp. TaxID=28214 RepID=UPI003B3A35D8